MKLEVAFQTERLFLSSIKWKDFAFFFRLIGSSEVRKFLGGPVPFTARLPRFRAYLRGHENVRVWLVRTQATKSAIGIIELSPHKDGKEYEISYQFSPFSWGRGFANEAGQCVVDYALNDLKLERVIAETQAVNDRSCRLLEGLGFIEIDRIERFGVQQKIYSKS